jgi:hypothetical protein
MSPLVAVRRATLVVLVDDRTGIAMREAVFVTKPAHPFVESEQGWAVVETSEPARKVAPCRLRDSRQQ